MLIPSMTQEERDSITSLSRRVNANSQLFQGTDSMKGKLIKKGEC